MRTTILAVATQNQGKLREIATALEGAVRGIELRSLADFPQVGEIPEPYETFEANAVGKAQTLCEATSLVALADDSGLQVDALGGFPGVQSARFAGPDVSDAERNAALVERLRDAGIAEDRWAARFVCVLAMALPGGDWHTFRGECEGILIPKPRGTEGFGYDPVFYVPEYGQTFAEMDLDLKNQISHRGLAFGEAMELIKTRWNL